VASVFATHLETIMAENRFIKIATTDDAWGTDVGDFNVAAEVQKLTDAAECRGIQVCLDGATPDENAVEIEWWDTWCREGHNWSVAQWSDWFYFDNE